MKNIILLNIVILTVLLFSCASMDPVTEETHPVKETEAVKTELPQKTVERTEGIKPDTLNDVEIKKAETDIGKLIEKLNKIIAAKDYESWKMNLSDNYIKYYSDPEILKKKTQSPLLVKYNIVLRSLEDYFNYVVVGSRQNVKLDDIKVLDRNRIKAYMFIKGTPVIIYELIKIDNVWKIGKF